MPSGIDWVRMLRRCCADGRWESRRRSPTRAIHTEFATNWRLVAAAIQPTPRPATATAQMTAVAARLVIVSTRASFLV